MSVGGDAVSVRSGRGSVPQTPVRDAGVALPLVLAATVMISLIVLPILNYSMSVMRANSVLSDKLERIEAVKSGLRVSLAQPSNLYEVCGLGGPNVPTHLANAEINGLTVSTDCFLLESQSALTDTELRFGLVATQVGQNPPAGLAGAVYGPPADPSSTSEWLASTRTASETDTIWLPNLATHGLNLRNPAGTSMPAGFPTCTVYFPGTYPDPLTLTGPTFFTSGIYYFEDEVRVEGGASVVVGDGRIPGCTTNQEAIFYAENVPGTHNMSGLGGTWVLGKRGRIVVSDANGSSPSLQFNTRYVSPDDVGDAPSADVSIITVNGELAADGTTGVGLDVPGVIEVPASLVGNDAPVPATEVGYLPSIFTPKPSRPDTPAAPSATKFYGAARVTWTPPPDGGSPITGYTVTASSGQTCSTAGATTCVVMGLSSSSGVNFTVTATNSTGTSDPSATSTNIVPNSPSLAAPAQPAAPTVVPYAATARVTWTAPAPPNAPITGYTVTAMPGGNQCTLDMTVAAPPTELTCDVTGLDPLEPTGYTFTVTADNAVGPSPASAQSAPIIPDLGLGAPPPPPEPPVAPAFQPTPVVDVDVAGSAGATVYIPGYVAVPQGRVRVVNPNADDIRIEGGILAAQFDVTDSRPSPPIGMVEIDVQRKFRLVSSTSQGGETSIAIVQVNQNGAYAVNSWEVQ